MLINKIKLVNFKFHKNLEFAINKHNCLIYGENGAGKSSIYWALYSLFRIYFRDHQFDVKKFQNHIEQNNLSVKVTLDEIELSIPNDDLTLLEHIAGDNQKTIYFANQDLLYEVTNNQDNFYSTIIKHLKQYFETLNYFDEEYKKINESLEASNLIEKNDEKLEIDRAYEEYITTVIEIANEIVTLHFNESFVIDLSFRSSTLDENNLKFPNPQIIMKINNNHNLKLNFNEAKIKLASIAIFFALIKIEEDTENPLKLLVLDDFLTSLDMANRLYIIQYIFNEFKEYQKIILTHNLQFYQLILTLLKNKNEIDDWDNKNIFTRKIGEQEEAIIYDKETDYIKQAQGYMEENKLDEAGIYLRKEFERLIEELRIIHEVGAKEKISNIIEELSKLQDTNDINIKKMQKVLKQTKFYQDTTLHSSAHDDPITDKYRKELDGAIVVLNQLRKQVRTFKKDKSY